MPRPRKRRRVCFMPENNLFGPLGLPSAERECLVMSVEEYESLRLIELEGLNQEECAERMNVARSTAQRIYNEAKRKLVDALVNGKNVKIEGGDYKLCDGSEVSSGCGRCKRRRQGRNHLTGE